ncbi:MAG: polyprenyl synthetase family protein [Thermoanaerobaculales bacterium]
MSLSSPGAFERFGETVKADVEAALERYISEMPQTRVPEVAHYAVLGGGHRWRAMTAIAAGSVFDEESSAICLPVACSVELAHGASMLLDDLPSMDDARFRRGKPCAHRIFPRWAVDMAPVLLVNAAYAICLRSPLAPEKQRVAAAIEISRAACWMIYGQEDDVAPARSSFDETRLLACYAQKSGALYGASAKAGGILCGADDEAAAELYEYGLNMGIAYQLLDDITDVMAGVDEVGKESGMDADKKTAIDLFGMEQTRRLIADYQDRALSHLEVFDLADDHPLRMLVRHVSIVPAPA